MALKKIATNKLALIEVGFVGILLPLALSLAASIILSIAGQRENLPLESLPVSIVLTVLSFPLAWLVVKRFVTVASLTYYGFEKDKVGFVAAKYLFLLFGLNVIITFIEGHYSLRLAIMAFDALASAALLYFWTDLYFKRVTISEVPQETLEAASTKALKARPSGLGGWLILVAFGLVLTPFASLGMLLKAHARLFLNGTWSGFLSLDSPLYNPGLAAVIIFEIIANLLIGSLAVYAFIIFLKKKKTFPRYVVLIYSINVLSQVFDLVFYSLIWNEGVSLENFSDLTRALIAFCVWVPYILQSRRVKNTFVE